MKSSNKQCCKCKTALAAVSIRKAYYCQDCFHYVFTGKYRTILLKLREKEKGKVLLACSGGASSTALVHLTKNFMKIAPEEKKKVQFIPKAIICNIDESTLFEGRPGSSDKLENNMKEHYSGFEYFSHRLEDVFDPGFTKSADFDKILKSTSEGAENGEYEHYVQLVKQTSELSTSEQLKHLFSNIKKTSAKEDLLWNLKMKILVTVAKREGCSYIFMGDSATRQAIKMISMTSKGRGYSIALDIGLDNSVSFPGLTIMRPMKDMLLKEICLYNHFLKIDQLVLPANNFSTMMPGKSSIERLTEEFIVGIDREFSSTVSTICRTILKLSPSANMDFSLTCAMCLMPFETNVGEWRRHITVTDVEGVELPKKEENGCGSCASSGVCCTDSNEKKNVVDMNKALCYSCQVSLKDYTTESVLGLPSYVAENVNDICRDNRLLDQIKDFLIEDDDE